MKNLIHFDNFSKINEGSSEGIHPAVREKLLSYLKENPKATYAEARDHIGETLKGWNLSEDDFEEAQKISGISK
jgi:hypothetical protein